MTLTLNAAGAALIKHFEGCRLSAYPDPASGGEPWTIGWGSTGPDIHEGLVWTQAQCDARFDRDSTHFAEHVAELVGRASANQFGALVSFAYNLGILTLAGSRLLRLHREGDVDGVVAEFGKWIHARGRIMTGLVHRRAAEALLYRTADGREDIAAIIAKAEGRN